VEFDYGKADLNNAAESKLKTLATLLADRPALKIEIAGHVDAEKDKESYKRFLFDRKVKAQKLIEIAKQGEQATSVDQIKIAPDEYPVYLAKAYKKETFAKPKNFFGFAKDLPVPEMEELMLAHTQVTDDDLRQLTIQRAQAVKDHLSKSEKVEAERIFLVEKSAGPHEKNANIKDSRVDFTIQ
jgi:hypothetical protein